MLRCEHCGKEVADSRGLAGHMRLVHPDVTPEPKEPVEEKATEAGPAILPDMRPGPIRPSVVGRYIKMLRPICATCQRGPGVPEDWWKRCAHNPYISVAYQVETVRRYEDLPDGRRRLVGTETIETPYERPNWVQVPAFPRVGSGLLVQKKRRRYGFIFPEELRSPEYPNGIANPCEFRDCWVQEGVKEYQWGRYCRLIEAQLVGHDARMDRGGGALEIGDSQKSVEKQRKQLEEVPV